MVWIHKKWAFYIHQGMFQEKITSYYVAFVGFPHFLAILATIGGQETFSTGTVSFSRSL
jgi:uncharacterized membrane protein